MIVPQKKKNNEERKKASGLIVISDGFQFHRENVRTTKKEIEQQKKKRSHLQMYNRALGSIANR